MMNVKFILTILASWAIFVSALFEDQAGKFDWKQKYVGEATHMGYYSNSQTSVLIVATKSHAVAGLDADNGVIRWRHVFERDSIGHVWDLHVSSKSKYCVSVSGNELLFLRVWDSVNGALVVEHMIKADRKPDLVSVSGKQLITVFYDGGEMEVVTYNYDNKKIGDAVKFVTRSPVQVGNIGGAECLLTDANHLVCAGDKGLHTLKLDDGKSASWKSHSLTGVKSSTLRTIGSLVEVEIVGGKLAKLNTDTGNMAHVEIAGNGVIMEAGCGQVMVTQNCETQGMDSEGNAYCDKFSREIKISKSDESQVTHVLSEDRGRLLSTWSVCEDDDLVQVVLVMEDAAIVSLTPGGSVMFIREEGLATLELVQMVGMGTDTSGQEFDIHRIALPGNFLDPQVLVRNFLSRIKRHVSQLQATMLTLTDLRLSNDKRQQSGDKFGLKKVVVGVTSNGKIYAFESRKGNLLWQYMVPGVGKSLLIQKDGRSDISEAQAMLVYKHNRSGYFTLTFNPVTGQVLANDPCPLELDQALLLPETHSDLSRPVMLVGKDNSAIILPAVAMEHLKEEMPRLFVMTEREGMLTGNMVNINGDQISLTPVWNMVTPGDSIVSVRSRKPDEVVHSAGRVLADRSVLFKYMNPNLALLMTEGQDTQSKTMITVQMMDLVTGKVFFSSTHKKVTGPFHAVHSENWAVYTYYNEKARRTEVVSLEMYEGKVQSNASTFSSIDSSLQPLVERQAYILPLDIVALEETMTTKGITSKHLLVATTDGSVLDLPMHMLDPRRPAPSTPAHLREPGIPPYIPELPRPHESMLNYKEKVEAIRGVVTSPSGLESTVIVLVYGLDVYGTRLAPSKGFDLIKDDFDYFMITVVIIGLVVASFITRRLSQLKMLNQAWR